MNTNEFLEGFESEKARIMADKRLSNQGKEEKIAKLKADYLSKAKALKKTLRKSVIVHSLGLRDAQSEQRQHLENEQNNFDYQRLNYEAQAVKAKIANARSLAHVEQLWNEAKKSGDAYKIKAWKDTVSLDRFENDPFLTKQKLFEELASVDVRERNPEIAEIENEHLRALGEIEGHAKALDAFLDDGKAIGRGKIERKVFEGIKFDREGYINTDFDYSKHPLAERMETAGEVADRLEREVRMNAERYIEVGRKFGVELDPDLDL